MSPSAGGFSFSSTSASIRNFFSLLVACQYCRLAKTELVNFLLVVELCCFQNCRYFTLPWLNSYQPTNFAREKNCVFRFATIATQPLCEC